MGSRKFIHSWVGIILSFCLFNACSLGGPIHQRDTMVSNLQGASIILFSRCGEEGYEDGKFYPVVRPEAKIRAPWSERIQVDFWFNTGWPERTTQDRRPWRWYSTDILVDDKVYPADLIRQGLISFDEEKIVNNQSLPSLIKEKIPIGSPRSAHINKLSFANCQDFLLNTDFGKRRTIVCPDVGVIAEDHYSEYRNGFYPVWRVLATHKLVWNYSKFQDITKCPPYWEELAAKVENIAKGFDFMNSCEINFLDILHVAP